MTTTRRAQHGVFLLEALIGLVIFSIGVLAMIALQTTAIAVQSDAQFRIEAANLADRMMGEIALNVNRTTAATIQGSLANFQHLPTVTPIPNNANCNFTGAAAADATVTAWAADVVRRLPGATAAMQQIVVTNATFNQVAITVCWQSPSDAVPRRHTVISYVN